MDSLVRSGPNEFRHKVEGHRTGMERYQLPRDSIQDRDQSPYWISKVSAVTRVKLLISVPSSAIEVAFEVEKYIKSRTFSSSFATRVRAK